MFYLFPALLRYFRGQTKQRFPIYQVLRPFTLQQRCPIPTIFWYFRTHFQLRVARFTTPGQRWECPLGLYHALYPGTTCRWHGCRYLSPLSGYTATLGFRYGFTPDNRYLGCGTGRHIWTFWTFFRGSHNWDPYPATYRWGSTFCLYPFRSLRTFINLRFNQYLAPTRDREFYSWVCASFFVWWEVFWIGYGPVGGHGDRTLTRLLQLGKSCVKSDAEFYRRVLDYSRFYISKIFFRVHALCSVCLSISCFQILTLDPRF